MDSEKIGQCKTLLRRFRGDPIDLQRNESGDMVGGEIQSKGLCVSRLEIQYLWA